MLKNKFVLIVMAIIIVLFASNSFGSINVENIAIIAAISIDKKENEYEICAQIATSDTSSGSVAVQKTSVLAGKGPTPAAAIDDIAQKTGWLPDFTFCALVLMGEGVYTDSIMPCIDFIIRDKHFCDNAILTCTEGVAKDYLTSKTTLDEAFAFSLVKILSKDNYKNIHSNITTVKEFTKDFYAGRDNSLSFIQKIPSDIEDPGSPEAPDAKGGEELMDFIVVETIMFKGDSFAGKLDKYQSEALHLLTKKVSGGHIDLNGIQVKDYYIDKVELLINSMPAKICLKFDKEKHRVFCDISLKVNVGIVHAESENMPKNENLKADVPVKIKENLKQLLHTHINELLKATSDSSCDLLKLEDKFFKFHPSVYRKYFEKGSFFLEDIVYNVDIKISSQR